MTADSDYKCVHVSEPVLMNVCVYVCAVYIMQGAA